MSLLSANYLLWHLLNGVLVAVTSRAQATDPMQFNVLDFGAVGDGMTDDTQAFADAWLATCGATIDSPTLTIPEGRTFLLRPITFKGPCNSTRMNIQIHGTLVAPDTSCAWKDMDASLWLQFDSVSGLTLGGSGRVHGRGSNWWQQSCKLNRQEGCTTVAPTAIQFTSCEDLVVNDLSLQDSPQTHVLIRGSDGVTIANLRITAPANSPNTDGIHIHDSRHVKVQNTIIGTGDDCISIGDKVYGIEIEGVMCGPGHGISVGSLGKGGSSVSVEGIRVSFVKLFNTTNGVRIKTWQGGTGYVKSISFDHINFNRVKNPIIIDQYYCSIRHGCSEQENAVQISNVVYSYLSGTSETSVAVSLNCSRSLACQGVHMQNVDITASSPSREVEAFCINAHGDTLGYIRPAMPCLSAGSS